MLRERDPAAPQPPIEYWTGVAKLIQNTLGSSEIGRECKWPCMKRFITGSCDDPTCRVCKNPQSNGGKGDEPARKLARDTLGNLISKGRISKDCMVLVNKGKSARA